MLPPTTILYCIELYSFCLFHLHIYASLKRHGVLFFYKKFYWLVTHCASLYLFFTYLDLQKKSLSNRSGLLFRNSFVGIQCCPRHTPMNFSFWYIKHTIRSHEATENQPSIKTMNNTKQLEDNPAHVLKILWYLDQAFLYKHTK